MDESRLQKLERRLDELDQRSTAMERAIERAMDRSKAAMGMIVPTQTRRHLRNAGREQLLAVRSMLDHWVDRMADRSDAEQDDDTRGGRENIPID